MSDYLSHYGIKGMKWGIRRYQNKDGTLTAEGRKRVQYRNNIMRNRSSTDDVNDIVSTLTDKEKKFLGASLNEQWIEKEFENDTLTNKAKTIVQKEGNTPISFIELWTNDSTTAEVAIATRNDPKYRGKGYADMNVEQAIKWVERYGNNTIKEMRWAANSKNVKSIALAKRHGFVEKKEQKYPGYTDMIRKNPNYRGK